MLTACIKCLCCKTVREWKSQPEIRNYAAGDILLSGATLFNGLLPNKFLHTLMPIKIACISPRTFLDFKGNFCMELSEMFGQNNKMIFLTR